MSGDPAEHGPYSVSLSGQARSNIREHLPLEVAAAALETIERSIAVNPYRAGKPLDEPYVHFLFPPPGDTPEEDFDVRVHYGPVTVPPDHYFMMGDNRDNSEDSRYWGFLPRNYVKGKAAFIYWSFEDTEEGQPAGGISRFFTTIRWSRLLHQIH